jgi:hypothetical protein
MSTPGPVETPASNAHRVGAPNHHQNTGSGETLMVDVHPSTDAVMVAAVRDRLNAQTYRFVTATGHGLGLHVEDMAAVVTEIITDYTDHLTAERDALAEDLAWELNAYRPATGVVGGGA